MEQDKAFLGKEPIGKLLLKLALPTVAAQMINMLYNLVDRIYIGHIPNVGVSALAGVGVCMPLIMLVSAFAALVGYGGSPRVSIYMGKKDNETAEKILGNCFAMQIIISAILTAVLLIWSRDLLMLFGASRKSIEYAVSYMNIYAVGTIFVELTLGMNAFITAQGFAKTGMLSVLIGAISNIILDPIFIFGFGMGVKGAALATIISQALSCIWVISFLMGRKTMLKIRKENLLLRPKIIFPCLALGAATFVMQASESVISVCFNASLQSYGGDMAVSAMAILTSVMQFALLPLQGLGQGAQPIISYNYGAGNKSRVKGAIIRLIAVCFLATIVLAGIAVFAPGVYAEIFTNNDQLVKLTCQVMPIYFFGITIFGIQSACQSTFLALGQAKVSLFIALLRKVILLIPLAIILPKFMGVIGIYRAEPVADIISVLATSVLFVITVKKVLRSMGNNDMISADQGKDGGNNERLYN